MDSLLRAADLIGRDPAALRHSFGRGSRTRLGVSGPNVAPALLGHVRKLVRQQLSARSSPGPVTPCGESDLLAGGKSLCPKTRGGGGGGFVRVNTDTAEIASKLAFKKRLFRRRQGLRCAPCQHLWLLPGGPRSDH